ncbi:MAG: DUF4932 domain-containing protein [Bacteroidetes bacterium]|nr:MAG: DUF4932 domain-containing protein [Bacteroidota bacterium]
MKRNILIIGVLFSFAAFGQSTGNVSQTATNYFPLPKVDKRIELLSIVFRLAGNMEYNDEIFKSYTSDIHNHFDKYSEHELIKFTRKIRDKNWIGFDAVMKMAIYLEQPPTLNPIVPFTADIPDRRWGEENAIEFLKLLQQFYTDAKCDDFFNAHKELYRISAERYNSVYESIDLNWFNHYYGTELKGSFNIVPGLGNGGGNYGVKAVLPDGNEAMYAIMQTSSLDSTNIPIYDVDFNLPTLIHEFNHSYVNDIQKKYEKDLENSGVKLYGIVSEAMRRQAYTDWKTMLNEALVRASVIRYLIDHNSDRTVAKKQLMSEYGRGFFWIKGLVDCLGEYEKNRDKYPTLESYMPVIINFYNGVGKEIDLMFEI